jgi:hypothetical protein
VTLERKVLATYKVSLVIPGTEHSGTIVNLHERPQVGEHLRVGDEEVEVLEVIDLMPPRGEFRFLHATCRLIKLREQP